MTIYTEVEREALYDACSRSVGGIILGQPFDRHMGGISTDALVDFARAGGIMSICLGCGTVYSVGEGISEELRLASRVAYEREGILECCPDADSLML